MENTKERVHSADERLRIVVIDDNDTRFDSQYSYRVHQKYKKITAPPQGYGYFN